MRVSQRAVKPLHERTLTQLCNLIIAHKFPFEDLAEFIEDRAYEVCADSGRVSEVAVRQIKRVADFFGNDKRGGAARKRRLADVYMLVGELYLYHDEAARSVKWFRKAIAAKEDYAAPFHSLAIAQTRIDDLRGAVHSLEEELLLSPGNLYSYLILADLYEQRGDAERFEETLHRLLVRDADNVQALHRLIAHYETAQPETDVELLRRRILTIRRDFSKAELIIWTYHMCRAGRLAEALRALQDLEATSPTSPTVHLLKAAVFGEMRQFARKKRELAAFKQALDGHQVTMAGELREFEHVFGGAAVAKLGKRLAISNPSAHAN